MKKICLILPACSLGVVLQAQTTVIDPLNGDSLSAYNTYLVNDVSAGAGQGVSFSDVSGGLVASYVGTGTTAEQALFLTSASSYSTVFGVGDTLLVGSTMTSSSTAEDFGLAISSGSPVAASSGNSYNSRTAFDWMSISVRENGSGGTIRVNTSISGTLTTASYALSPTLPIDDLYIDWVSGTTFSFGYINSADVLVPDSSVTFGATSTIGSDIGFYGDLRGTGTSLGSLDNLTIQAVPEPSSMGLFGITGAISSLFMLRRRK